MSFQKYWCQNWGTLIISRVISHGNNARCLCAVMNEKTPFNVPVCDEISSQYSHSLLQKHGIRNIFLCSNCHNKTWLLPQIQILSSENTTTTLCCQKNILYYLKFKTFALMRGFTYKSHHLNWFHYIFIYSTKTDEYQQLLC